MNINFLPQAPPGVTTTPPPPTFPPPVSSLNLTNLMHRMRTNIAQGGAGTMGPSAADVAVEKMATDTNGDTSTMGFLMQPAILLLIAAVGIGGYFLLRKKGKK